MSASPPPDRRAIGLIGAYVEGWRRVLRAPVMCLSVLVATTVTLVALGAAGGVAELRRHERTSIDTYLLLEHAPGGRFIQQAVFFGDPLTVGADTIDAPGNTMTAAAAVARYVGLWIFLWGGILDRVARNRRVGTAGFFAACGVYFFRFLRLSVPVFLAYWAIFRWLQNYLVIYFLAMIAVMVLADFARVRAVVEDRRSMIGALIASFRFIRRRIFDVVALYVFWLGALAVVTFVPSTTVIRAGLPAWLETTAGLVLLIAFLYARLALGASQIVYFQSALAHADYTAAPLPTWPDSPAAEAIENLAEAGRRKR